MHHDNESVTLSLPRLRATPGDTKSVPTLTFTPLWGGPNFSGSWCVSPLRNSKTMTFVPLVEDDSDWNWKVH